MTTARRKIVITGASGNVGTGVLRALTAALPGDEVVGVCRRPPAGVPAHHSVSWCRVDLSKSSACDDLAPAMRGADVVIHLALALRPAGDEDYLYRVNVGGTRAVLSAMSAAGVHQLIYASSLAVYAPGATDPVSESWLRTGQRTSVYSRHKVAAERLVDGFAQTHPEVAVARIRPTLVVQRESAWEVRTLYLGPFVPRAVLKLLRRRALPIMPLPAGIAMQFVHADDVGDAVVRLLQTRATGSFNLAADILDARALAGLVGGSPVAVNRRLLRKIVTALHALRVVAVTPGWYDVAMNSPLMDTSCAREELGWSPTRSSTDSAMELLDGLARGSVGYSAAMGAIKDDRTGLRRATDQLHDGSLLLWTAATSLRAVGIGRVGVLDAAFVATNLIAGTPAALERLRMRRRDPVALLAPVAVVAAVAATLRGGRASVAPLVVLNLFAEAERRRRKMPNEQHDSRGFGTPQVVVVTGASSGIGRETALLFAGRHARLSLGSRSEAALQQVADECRKAGAADVVVQSTDIAEADQVQNLFDTALARFGRVDVVVQCAALTAFGRFEDLPVEVFDTVVRTNLIGAANVARSALTHFQERGCGHLVLLGSLLGQAAMPYQSAYIASKFGVHGMVRALRQENSHLPGVKVHAVYPGPVSTTMSSNAGNYFGHLTRVPPTAVGPITVAATIVRATTRGHSTQRHVGWFNRPMVIAYRIAPSIFDALAGRLTRWLLFTRQATGISAGNVAKSTAVPPVHPYT